MFPRCLLKKLRALAQVESLNVGVLGVSVQADASGVRAAARLSKFMAWSMPIARRSWRATPDLR